MTFSYDGEGNCKHFNDQISQLVYLGVGKTEDVSTRMGIEFREKIIIESIKLHYLQIALNVDFYIRRCEVVIVERNDT